MDLEEAKLMDLIYEQLFNYNYPEEIQHKFNIEEKHFKSMYSRIIEYNRFSPIFEYLDNGEWHTEFEKIHESDKFIKAGGFQGLYLNTISENLKSDELALLKEENLRLQNESYKYEQTIRELKQSIDTLTEKDLELSIFQKYWYIVAAILSAIAYFLGCPMQKLH